MASSRLQRASRTNIKKAQARRQRMSSRQRAPAEPEKRRRQRPGAGGGLYYRVEVRSRSGFRTFRTQDVGRKGHILRIAGRLPSGSWATITWLIAKEDAHIQNGRLVADTAAARKLIDELGSPPRRTQGDRFRAADRPNVPERLKPTLAQRRARRINIKKAQVANRGRR